MKSVAAAARRWLLWHTGLPGRLRFESVVLMYHRFCAEEHGNGLAREHFASQLDYLCRHFDVVPLEEGLAPGPGGRPRVVITVDDGYRSFYEYAWPELKARRLTAIVYLPTQFIDDGGWMWQDRNIYLLRGAEPGRYRCAWQGGELTLDLSDERALLDALLQVYELGRRMDLADRLELGERLSQCLNLPLPETPPPNYAPMSWQEVRELQDAGIAFGSHTVNHAILTTCDRETAHREVTESRLELAAKLGRPVAAFAYPNGEFDPDMRGLVAAAGYTSAVATYAGYWSAGGDVFAVPRLPAPVGGAGDLADRLWCWWRAYGAPPPQLASRSP